MPFRNDHTEATIHTVFSLQCASRPDEIFFWKEVMRAPRS